MTKANKRQEKPYKQRHFDPGKPCGAKSEHIATDWQDANLARRWMTLADRLGLLAIKAKEL